MNANVTVSVRSILLATLVALALVVAYLLGSGGGPGTPARAADDQGDTTARRVLTMTGTGDASAVPDELSFGLGVTVTRTDLGDALDAASATMGRVLVAVAKYGVAKSDVQTTGLSMTPVYDYHPYDPPTIRGYRVTQRASVLVKDLKAGGRAVAAAVAAGGNDVRVSNLRLLVGDPDAATARARDAAVAEARAKAEQYADASGQALGDVLTLREVHVKPLPTTPAVHLARGMMYDAALKGVPIRAGKERTAVTVRMVWELA
ncbi:SIMPL domain-containing protein [Nocardioides aquiterrae]|uniref:SIMPL domain-containing protein n=1 Tax=Nocardioides aquiterrae TaxID=203799 RepID=A0ABN1UG69_9ACTN